MQEKPGAEKREKDTMRVKKLLIMLLAALLMTGCTVNVYINAPATEAPAATAAPVATSVPTPVLPSELVRQEKVEYQALSASPDGKTELCAKAERLYIRHGDSVIPVTVNESRGVADTYGHLAVLYDLGVHALGGEGAIWSPDGRYITLANCQYTMMRCDALYDPVLIDTRTGEMFLAATYNFDVETLGELQTGSVFSTDGRYLFVLLYGFNADSYEQRLVRINLQTLAQEELVTCDYWMCAPGFYEMADGSLVYVGQKYLDRPPYLIRLHEGKSGWEASCHELTALGEDYYLSMLLYSKAYDAVLIPVLTGSKYAYPYFLLLGRYAGGEFTGLDEGWWIPTLNSEKAELRANFPLTAERAATILGVSAEDAEGAVDFISTTMEHAVMSSDGESVLLLCKGDWYDGYEASGRRCWLLLRLADMSLTRLEGAMNDEALNDLGDMGGLYWCGDTVSLVTYDVCESYALR